MAFEQYFNNVKTVKNIESNDDCTTDTIKFKQEYGEVGEVLNLSYSSDEKNSLILLLSLIENLNPEQTKSLEKKLLILESNPNNDKGIKKLIKNLRKDKDIKESIIEIIKSGTATISFATAICNLIKVIIGN